MSLDLNLTWEIFERDIKLTQSNKKETEGPHLTMACKEIKLVISYSHERQRLRWFYRWILVNLQGKGNPCLFQVVSKNRQMETVQRY